jgi:hypothetical protein
MLLQNISRILAASLLDVGSGVLPFAGIVGATHQTPACWFS